MDLRPCPECGVNYDHSTNDPDAKPLCFNRPGNGMTVFNSRPHGEQRIGSAESHREYTEGAHVAGPPPAPVGRRSPAFATIDGTSTDPVL